MTNEQIEHLIIYRDTLRAFCHSKNCRYHYKCPAEHKSCKPQLNIGTAVLWCLAVSLNKIIVYPEQRTKKDDRKKIDKLLQKLEFVLHAYILHNEEYRSEYDTLRDLHNYLLIVLM